MSLDPIVLLVLIGLLSISCQLFAHKVRLPAILPLLITGIMVGPVFNVLDSNALFGDLLFPLVSLSVAIILFEGALTLDFKQLGAHGKVVTRLCTLGVLIGWVVVAPAAHFFIGVSWEIAFLFSAIVTVTGPTVILPMLRAVRPSKNVSQILRWEGIIVDPIGAILAVLVFEYIISSQNATLHTLMTFGQTILVGVAVGVVFGYGMSVLLRKGSIPDYLINTAVLTMVLGAFELANIAAHEAGLITVTIIGVWLANARDVDVERIIEFKETLSVLLISALFIILAARVDLNQLADIALGSIALLGVILLIARPISVYLATWRTSLRWQEKWLVIWMAPRGIIAAAVSALFALKLEQQGYENAQMLVALVFFVIIFTVTIQSLTTTQIAQFLGEREPAPVGYLIFGGQNFARMLAKELQNAGITVKICDTNWDAISAARMENIPTYYGNPSSAHAERTMDLTGIGNVLVLSPHKHLNAQITQYFQHIFGEDRVFGLHHADMNNSDAHLPNYKYLKSLGLFGALTYSKLASLTASGAVVKKTTLTEQFGIQEYHEKYANNYTPLFMQDPKGRISPFKKESQKPIQPGTQLISLINPDAIKPEPSKT
ncbi:cation:proton antiporter [Aestuariibacter sp. AA17]|uniref:Cation:proton antiporter n=1 Tax=Fluctibacter corallii TaxID=2984329 RepID=A0ABT3ADG5_9ALTE|nr:sodium:proton antiporter [Aestuariibacter sp. AA17]MCV2886622.1 cation:proton antiporter [Aestuariibacter sp. AA17]